MWELPAKSMTLKPVRSRTSATGSAMPACIRIPQRLCWPSRRVESRISTLGMRDLLAAISRSRLFSTLPAGLRGSSARTL